MPVRVFPDEIRIDLVDALTWAALSSESGHHSICWGPENKREEKEEICHFLSRLPELGYGLLLILNGNLHHRLSSPGSQAFGLRLNYTSSVPGSPPVQDRLWDLSASIITL